MRSPLSLIALVALLAAASSCSTQTTRARGGHTARNPRPSESATTGKISWFEDDYAAALARANAEKKPLVIDGWAMWCAPCIAMRDEVLSDPSIQAEVDRFVWLSLDDDNEKNRPVQIRHHIESLPTFVLVDPSHDAEVARWVGVTDPRVFRRFLAGGERWFRIETSHDLDALSMLRSSAEKNDVFGDQNATSSLFAKVIKQAPATWPQRDEVAEQLIRSLLRKGDPRCADEASKAIESPPSGESATRLDVLDAALSCVTVEGVSADKRTEIERRVRPELRAFANMPAGLSVEDRDLAYVRLREQAIAHGDHDEAANVARERLNALDDAASAAFERRRGSRFDLLRAMAMVDVGQTELALMMLKNSQEEISDDADTTVRLATFLLKIGRYEAALDEATKGLGHTRGVRVARLHAIRGDALIALNRPHEAREALEIARARVEALPWAMREDQEIEKLRATIARLSSLP